MSEMTAEQAHLFVHNVILGLSRTKAAQPNQFSRLYPVLISIIDLTRVQKQRTNFCDTLRVRTTSF